MRVYFTAVDNGDGSLGVVFFNDPLCIPMMEEFDPETYRGEGGGWLDIVGPAPVEIRTLESVRDEIEEYERWNEELRLLQTSEKEDC